MSLTGLCVPVTNRKTLKLSNKDNPSRLRPVVIISNSRFVRARRCERHIRFSLSREDVMKLQERFVISVGTRNDSLADRAYTNKQLMGALIGRRFLSPNLKIVLTCIYNLLGSKIIRNYLRY